ncbi:MAG: hypothetical protein ACTSRG_10350 [Candidatus Helarchaeota archaeon]
MAKAKKPKKQTKNVKKGSKSTKKANKSTKKRGRPVGSKNKKVAEKKNLGGNEMFSFKDPSGLNKTLNAEDYDNMLIKELKSKRKAKEKAAIKDEYDPEFDVEDDGDVYDIEGYDIETPEGFEFEDSAIMPKKSRRKKKRNYYDDLGVDTEFYESDYNIGEFQDYE